MAAVVAEGVRGYGVSMDFLGTARPLTAGGLRRACERAGVTAAELWAVLLVETSGCGFLPDRRPKILFERHVFHGLTGGRFDADHPDVSQPAAGGYGRSGGHQYERLAAAIELDEEAALRSASWGLPQVLGRNFREAGFSDVRAMVAAMAASEDRQLEAMAAFLLSARLDAPLRQHDWPGFARRYNGPGYAASNYHGRLAQLHARLAQGDWPDLAVRTAQIHLYYRGYSIGPIDGRAGDRTRRAILAFQSHAGLEMTGTVAPQLLAALEQPDIRPMIHNA